jgi:hypothetical protein
LILVTLYSVDSQFYTAVKDFSPELQTMS